MNIQIFTMTHKKFDVPKDPMYQPLHVGKAGKEELGYPGDDTGDNISELNCYYSELTGLYWIWKNYSGAGYVGTCHYRRYLINEREQVFTEQELEVLLQKYEVITTKRIKLNNSYHFGFAANHNVLALNAAGDVIKELYPDDYPVFHKLVHADETYFGNIMVTSKALFDEYAAWLFSIFFQVQERVELETGEDDYHKRVFGFISEFLLLVWVTARRLSVCECKVGMLGEKAETREMKERLAEYFAQKDIQGAKNYFLKRREERPDVLMEASDVTGELRLAMQIIATADLEWKKSAGSVLDRECDFSRLMSIFTGMNRAVHHYRNGQETEEDIRFLKKHRVSETAVRIAVMLLKADEEDSEKIQNKICQDINYS